MTIHEKGLEWIATNLGISNCTVASGISGTYTDVDGNTTSMTLGSSGWLTIIYDTALVQYVTIGGVKKYYSSLKTANKGADVSYPTDHECVRDNLWCIGATVPACVTPEPVAGPCPTQCIGADLWAYKRDVSNACVPDYRITENSTACPGYVPPGSKKVAPPMEFTFLPPCDGNPTVLIDISMLGMRQEGDTFYISGFKVQNTRECVAHFAMHLKIWDLAPGAAVPTACPTATPEWDGVSRSTWDPEEPYIRTTTIEPGETETINMNFFVPTTVRGRKTLCIYVWGNFSKFALFDELETELGEV